MIFRVLYPRLWRPLTRTYSSWEVGNNGPKAGVNVVTLQKIRRMYREQVPITMLTAYDYPTGMAADDSGVDIILVGDSLANVALGLSTTAHLKMPAMMHHCAATRRGVSRALLLGDMPFGTYHTSTQVAVESAIQMVQEGMVDGVKLEGCRPDPVRAIVDAGIPVVAHIGLTPQTAAAQGGLGVRGKTAISAQRIMADAAAVEAAGACMLVLEALPEAIAQSVTQQCKIPTIGIGAGRYCSGQVLVQNDLLGITQGHIPKFVSKSVNVGNISRETIKTYVRQVKAREFPGEEHTYAMDPEQLQRFHEINGTFSRAEEK